MNQPVSQTNASSDIDDLLGDLEDQTVTKTEPVVECKLDWKPAGIRGGKNDFAEGDIIMAAIQFWTAEAQERWKFLQLTYQSNNVFLCPNNEPYAWHRITCWVSKEEIIPNLDTLPGA